MYDHVVFMYLDEVRKLVLKHYQASFLRYLGVEKEKLDDRRHAEEFIANDLFDAQKMNNLIRSNSINSSTRENPVLGFASFLYQCVGTLYEEITQDITSRFTSHRLKTINDLNYILWLLKCQFTFQEKKRDGEVVEVVEDNPKDWEYIPKSAMDFVLEHPEYYFTEENFIASCSKTRTRDYSLFLQDISSYFDRHDDIYMSGDAYNAFVAYIDNAIDTCVHEKTLIARDVEVHWITYWGEEKTETDLRLQFLRMDRGKLYRIVADTCQITRLESNYSVSTEPKIGYFADDYFARDAFLNDCSSVKARRFDSIAFFE